jgi:hypothetical protein
MDSLVTLNSQKSLFDTLQEEKMVE